ncbi:MAG: hypothetical protein J0L91_02610 [Burkholderiales bacterium]|nr:hypothetical protein [Burkholderiales bacterium]
MAVVNRKSVRVAARDRVHEAIEASRGKLTLPTHGDDRARESRATRWGVFHERLHSVVAEAMHSPAAFAQVVAAVAALARYDADMATALAAAVPTESKRGRRPRRAWQDDEIVGFYESFLTDARSRSQRYPKAVARREVADAVGMNEDAVRSVLRRMGVGRIRKSRPSA